MKSNVFLNRIIRLSSVALAAGMITATAAGCSSSGSNAALDSAFDYAKSKVSAFSSASAANNFAFSDQFYSKANIAAMLYKNETDAEMLKQIIRNIGAESIIVTDGKGMVTATYPEDSTIKDIKEKEELLPFIKAAKGISAKIMSEPVPVEGSDEYTFSAAVKRADDAGAVIVGFKSDEYSKITGEKLADECGPNVIVIKDDKVLSTTLKDFDSSKSVSDLGISTDDVAKGSFGFKTDLNYNCKSEKVGDYTLVCAVPN